MKLTKIILTAFMTVAVFCGMAIAQNADSALLNNQGVEYYQRGNYSAAVQKFQDAISIDPTNENLYVNLGYTYQSAGDHFNAVKIFKKAIALDPSNLDAHNSLGVSLYQTGAQDRAMEEWQFVLSLDPGNSAAAANLAIARHPENVDEIVTATKAGKRPTLKKGPSSAAAYFIMGKQAFKSQDYGKSEEIFSQILETKPDSKFSYYFLGMSQAYLDKPQEAMKNLREYLIQETYPPEGAYEYERAMSVFKMLKAGKALKPRVDYREIQAAKAFETGKEMYLKKDYIKAVHYLRQASAIKPDSYPVNYYLGLSYKEIGDKERATFHLTKCLLAGPNVRSKEEALKIASVLRELTK